MVRGRDFCVYVEYGVSLPLRLLCFPLSLSSYLCALRIILADVSVSALIDGAQGLVSILVSRRTSTCRVHSDYLLAQAS